MSKVRRKQFKTVLGFNKWEFEILCMLYAAKKNGVNWVGQLTISEVASLTTNNKIRSIAPRIRCASAYLFLHGLVLQERMKPVDGWRTNLCKCLSLSDKGTKQVEQWLT